MILRLAAIVFSQITFCLALPGNRPPNVLFIVSEDNGPELGCYGDPHARTPNIDRLARQGVRFANAFVTYSVCSPSRASFLTGLYPQQNGQIGLATHRFSMYRASTPNIVTLLRGAGIRTGLVGKLHVSPEDAFPFDFRAIDGGNFSRKEPPEAYVKAAADYWQEAGERPWFLSVNFPEAHLPFLRQVNGQPAKPRVGNEIPPLPWVGADSDRLRQLTTDYYNCMERLDESVRLLLEALAHSGMADNTLVIYFGDHGAQFPRGKGTVYDGGMRVPLLMRWPGKIAADSVRTDLVSTLDLLPTVLKAVGIDVPGNLPGLALQPLFANKPAVPWRQYIFGITTGSNAHDCVVQESVQDSRWKLIWTPPEANNNLCAKSYLGEPGGKPYYPTGLMASEYTSLPAPMKAVYDRWRRPPLYELYDLQRDPNEFTNLADDPANAAIKSRLISALQVHQKAIVDPFQHMPNVRAYVDEQMQNVTVDYRRIPGFRWKHTDAFRDWRDQQSGIPKSANN